MHCGWIWLRAKSRSAGRRAGQGTLSHGRTVLCSLSLGQFIQAVICHPAEAIAFKAKRLPVLWLGAGMWPDGLFDLASLWCVGTYGLLIAYVVVQRRHRRRIPEPLYLYLALIVCAMPLIHFEFRYTFPVWNGLVLTGLLLSTLRDQDRHSVVTDIGSILLIPALPDTGQLKSFGLPAANDAFHARNPSKPELISIAAAELAQVGVDRSGARRDALHSAAYYAHRYAERRVSLAAGPLTLDLSVDEWAKTTRGEDCSVFRTRKTSPPAAVSSFKFPTRCLREQSRSTIGDQGRRWHSAGGCAWLVAGRC